MSIKDIVLQAFPTARFDEYAEDPSVGFYIGDGWYVEVTPSDDEESEVLYDCSLTLNPSEDLVSDDMESGYDIVQCVQQMLERQQYESIQTAEKAQQLANKIQQVLEEMNR
jgi:hypothetical protein